MCIELGIEGIVNTDPMERALPAPTLEFTIVLNVSIVHEGTSFSNFSIFTPPTYFFWHFRNKIGIYDPNLA
jgi:hypothetical protein